MSLNIIDGLNSPQVVASILNSAGEHQTTQITKSLASSIVEGEIPGASATVKFGRILSIASSSSIVLGTPSTWKDVWAYADTQAQIPEATTGALVSIASDSANDAAAGTGAQTVILEGIDQNWDAQTETVTLNGTTPVNTINQWIAINRAYIAAVGSFGTNEGNITFTHTGIAGIISYIEIHQGQTAQAVYTVPRNKILIASGPYLTMTKAGTTGILSAVYRTKEFGQGWRTRTYGEAISTGTSFIQAPVADIPSWSVLGKGRCKVQVTGISANNIGCTAGWGHAQVDAALGQ